MQRRRTMILLSIGFLLAATSATAVVLFPATVLQFFLNRTGHRVEGLRLELFSMPRRLEFDLFEKTEPTRFVRLKDVRLSIDRTGALDAEAASFVFRDTAKPAVRLSEELAKIDVNATIPPNERVKVLHIGQLSIQLSASSDPVTIENVNIDGGKPLAEQLQRLKDELIKASPGS